MADQAAWSAPIAQPLVVKDDGSRVSASASTARQSVPEEASVSSTAKPSQSSSSGSSPVSTAWRIISDQRAAASPARSWWWVSSLTASAASTSACAASRWASATGAVRMREPLPALLPVCSWRASAADAIAAAPASRPAALRTRAVWTPTSGGLPAYQAAKFAATPSRASTVRRSAPVAATVAMAIACAVSSVHSPGAKFPRPPPIMAGHPSYRRLPNS